MKKEIEHFLRHQVCFQFDNNYAQDKLKYIIRTYIRKLKLTNHHDNKLLSSLQKCLLYLEIFRWLYPLCSGNGWLDSNCTAEM